MTFDQLKEKALSLPLKPGVYLMMDREGTVIYVGKAKALKNRVSQYFHDQAAHTEKTRAMVAQIDHFDTIVAGSEFEALVLENSLIKRHKPRYNILLKDDKGYPYIRLSVKEAYPRFSIQGRMADDGARYFGPFGGRHDTQSILDALRTALKLPACGKVFPRDQGKERPCLNYHMGQCDGYCRKEVPRSQHQQAIEQAVRLLEGKFGEVEKELKGQMEEAAEALGLRRPPPSGTVSGHHPAGQAPEGGGGLPGRHRCAGPLHGGGPQRGGGAPLPGGGAHRAGPGGLFPRQGSRRRKSCPPFWSVLHSPGPAARQILYRKAMEERRTWGQLLSPARRKVGW